MEQSKRFKLNFIILSAGYILLGLLRLFMPDPQSLLLCYLLGVLLLVAGIVRVLLYFAKDHEVRVFRNDLAIGVLLLVGGLYIIVQPASITAWLPVILGFCVVYDSILKLQYSFELKRTFKLWWSMLLAAIITALLGLLLILVQFEQPVMVYFFGSVLILDGVANLISLALLTFQMKKAQKAASRPMPKPSKKEKAAEAATKPAQPSGGAQTDAPRDSSTAP